VVNATREKECERSGEAHRVKLVSVRDFCGSLSPPFEVAVNSASRRAFGKRNIGRIEREVLDLDFELCIGEKYDAIISPAHPPVGHIHITFALSGPV
jgi:hypothetical protein